MKAAGAPTSFHGHSSVPEPGLQQALGGVFGGSGGGSGSLRMLRGTVAQPEQALFPQIKPFSCTFPLVS